MKYLVALGGLTVLIILITQILIGLRVIKVDFKYHKLVAWILLGFALIHATAALIYILS